MMRRILAPVLLLMGLGAQAQGACTGTNLFAALPAPEQAALQQRAHQTPWAEGLVFQATRDGRQITLAGTYHLPDSRHAALMDEIAPWLDDATTLWVEMGPQEEDAFIRARDANPALMFSTTGPTLPERLPPADWARLSAAAESRGIPAEMAARLKPAYLSMMLSIPPCAQADLASGEGGLDKTLMARAAARNIPIRAVEPWDTLFTIFGQMSPEQENALLRGALVDMNDNPDAAATVADLYFARQPRLIWELSEQWAQDSGLPQADIEQQMTLTEDRLMTARNRAWLPVIEQGATQGPVVVAVGALHLSGDTGLLTLLGENGWDVRRLD